MLSYKEMLLAGEVILAVTVDTEGVWHGAIFQVRQRQRAGRSRDAV